MSAELVERFERPSVRYGPLPLWWWSGERLDRERLRWQLRQLTEQGVWQAVVMNLAPTGPLYGALADDPPFMSEEWWAIFDDVCAEAASLGFQVWLYDQIGFSGANFQGRIVAADPSAAGRALEALRADARGGAVELEPPFGAEPLAAWFAPADGSPSTRVELEGGRARHPGGEGELVLAVATTRGFDYFAADAGAALIDATYGEYERRVGRWFGTGIGGVFQDELPDVPTWSRDFEPRFRAAVGYDVRDVLPAILGDAGFDGAPVDDDTARLDYHRARTRFAREGFFDPLAEWLDRTGLPCGFDQQSPAREGEPIGAVQHYADYLQTHARYRIPGSDHWGDSKVHASLAHAHGHERVWIEAFHSSGWGGTLEETYDWLSPYLRRGANLYDPHAVYYSTRGGWFEWAPPSTCWRQPYWPAYHAFAGAVTRLASVLTAGDHVAATVLYFPTEFVQSRLTADGRDLGAGDAHDIHLELAGRTAWFAERPGVLERAGADFDILGAFSLRHARATEGELRLRGERYRNVVLPGVDLLDAEVAELLADLVDQGGRVICVGRPPTRLAAGPEAGTGRRLLEHIAAGRVTVVDAPDRVPAALLDPDVRVRADAPVLHRRLGATHLIAAIAHDERSGTEQPMLRDFDDPWHEGDFDWTTYWQRLTGEGYRFRPPGDRPLTVRLEGLDPEGLSAQVWDPRTGSRREVRLHRAAGDTVEARLDFSVGSVAVLVVGPALPPPTTAPDDDVVERIPLDGPWMLEAASTLDNRWGDVAGPEHPDTVPVQVWEFDHTDEHGRGARVTATFGPFALVAGPDGEWRRAEWSLSRGIRRDPIHDASLGPNGYVPEEFLLWRSVPAGDRVRMRTTIDVPADPAVRLAVGANAERRVRVDGVELPMDATGYLTVHDVTPGGAARLEIEFTAVDDGDLRASFALVTEPERFRRPEWIAAADRPVRASTVVFATEFDLAADVTDARVQLSTEAPGVLLVNGVEVGRQSDFDPYAARRFTRVHPYDLAPVLRPGRNRIEVRSTDVGRPVAIRLDSVPAVDGGLGVLTGSGWSAERDGRPIAVRPRLQQFEDPRYGCLVPRPHPLQLAAWLEPAAAHSSVVHLVPDFEPHPGRVERLGFDVPLGAVELRVPTVVPFEVDDPEAIVAGDRIRLPSPARAGRRLELVFRPVDGRRGGALLDGPVEARVEPAPAELDTWDRLGLGALAGLVRARRTIRVDREATVRLDLGEVRGTVEVLVDGRCVETLFAGPWRVDLTGYLEPGRHHELEVIVRGTLAPYLAVASPTSAIAAGQTRHGLSGPVALDIGMERAGGAAAGKGTR